LELGPNPDKPEIRILWGTRELGIRAVEISKKLNIASSTASESAMRGRQIVEEHGLKLLEEDKSDNPRNIP